MRRRLFRRIDLGSSSSSSIPSSPSPSPPFAIIATAIFRRVLLDDFDILVALTRRQEEEVVEDGVAGSGCMADDRRNETADCRRRGRRRMFRLFGRADSTARFEN